MAPADQGENEATIDPASPAPGEGGGSDPYSLGPDGGSLETPHARPGLAPATEEDEDDEGTEAGERGADDPEGAEDDAEKDAEKETEEEDEAEVVSDDTEVDLGGGEKATIAELKEALADLKEAEPYVRLGDDYHAILTTFRSGEAGAREILETFLQQAEAQFGLGPEDFLPEGFEQRADDGGYKAKFQESQRRATALERELAKRTADYDSALKELEPQILKARRGEAAEAARLEIRRTLGREVTTKELQRMMEETGLDDPVKAYKLASFDKAAVPPKTKAPAMPKGAPTGKVFDPKDPSLTADRMVELMEQGYVPKGGFGKARGAAANGA